MTPRLVTIPISHFCEKARWALDRAGIAWTEEPHVQFFHILAARRAGGGRTVPVLVPGDGPPIGESAEILRWADARTPAERRLYPHGDLGEEAAVLERDLDARFGPDGRLWMYHRMLPAVGRLGPPALAAAPRWERWLFRAGHPLADLGIRRYLGVDETRAEAALARCAAVFDDVAARLDDGRRFLLGDRFTAADLAFAALAAPLLLPAEYGSPLPAVEAVPAPLAREARRFRAHPAGRFAARLYAEERR